MPAVIRPALMALAALASAAVATNLADDGREHEVTERPQVVVGETVLPGMVQRIERPGLYGVGDPSGNWIYAVVDSRLVRIDPATNIVLGVIRPLMLAN